jgi:hypothetical protein
VPAGSGPAGAGFALVAGVMGIVIGRRRRRG